MTSALAPVRSLDILAGEIITAHGFFVRSAKLASERARDVGLLLIEAKSQMNHGEWLPWLTANCSGISIRVAQGYMALARRPKNEDLRFSAVRDDLTTLADEWRPSADELGGGGSDDDEEDDEEDEDDEDDDEDEDEGDEDDLNLRMLRFFFSVAELVEVKALLQALSSELRATSREATLLEALRRVHAALSRSEAA